MKNKKSLSKLNSLFRKASPNKQSKTSESSPKKRYVKKGAFQNKSKRMILAFDFCNAKQQFQKPHSSEIQNEAQE